MLKKLIDIDNHVILIYDNGSDNESLTALKARYDEDNTIIVTGSEKNLGFSEGNNAGYRIAKELFPNLDFVVAMNSDLMIQQKDFIPIIEQYVMENEYSIIGPDVYNSHIKMHNNPLYVDLPEKKEIQEIISVYQNRLKNLSNAAKDKYYSDIKSKISALIPYQIISLYRKVRHVKFDYDYRKEYINPVISGCCVIYLRKYLENEDVLFEPDTFLYCEELLLSIKANRKGYKILYTPSLKVIHKESVSTRADVNSYEEYIKRESEFMIRSFNMVLEEMEK